MMKLIIKITVYNWVYFLGVSISNNSHKNRIGNVPIFA